MDTNERGEEIRQQTAPFGISFFETWLSQPAWRRSVHAIARFVFVNQGYTSGLLLPRV
jgi:hypothetical protein